MELGTLTMLLRQSVFEILKITTPVLGTALIVGLIVALLQAVTSIQEQTLTFVPKLFAILGILALLGSWMFASLRGFSLNIFEMIPEMAK